MWQRAACKKCAAKHGKTAPPHHHHSTAPYHHHYSTATVGAAGPAGLSRASDPAAVAVAAPARPAFTDVVPTAAASKAAEQDYVLVTPDRLDLDAVVQRVVDAGAGGVAVFVGTTRDNFNGKEVGATRVCSLVLLTLLALCVLLALLFPQPHSLQSAHVSPAPRRSDTPWKNGRCRWCSWSTRRTRRSR